MTISPATIARYQRVARIMRPAASYAEWQERHLAERVRLGTTLAPVIRYRPVPDAPVRGPMRSCA